MEDLEVGDRVRVLHYEDLPRKRGKAESFYREHGGKTGVIVENPRPNSYRVSVGGGNMLNMSGTGLKKLPHPPAEVSRRAREILEELGL